MFVSGKRCLSLLAVRRGPCLIAGTDILLGYHSEEGWTAAIHLLTGHYGLEVEVRTSMQNPTQVMSSVISGLLPIFPFICESLYH